MTPADLHILAKTDASVLPSESVKTLGVHNNPFRSCTSTSGYTVTPTAYRILCLRLAHLVRRYNHRLRHRPKTRYGWLAKPCPAETFTLQDTPSLTRRDLAVGVPVARHPPHSPGRAVFPHPVLRLYSLPRCKTTLSCKHPSTSHLCYTRFRYTPEGQQRQEPLPCVTGAFATATI